MKACEFCGIEGDNYLTQVGEVWLCSVHICKECGEMGHARHGGGIFCDTCYLSEGEGRECENCGNIDHIDLFSGSICQRCEDNMSINYWRGQ